jgi:pantothenate kinase
MRVAGVEQWNRCAMETSMHAAVEAIEGAMRARDAKFVALAGVPGAGKSTIAHALCARWARAVVLPMDGYHLPKGMLDAEGMRRRGAPHTFAPDRLRADLRRLKATGAGTFPAFDHAEGDPREAAIRVAADERPVIVEGLYLLLAEWRLESLFELRVFLDCPLDLALQRVASRHLACGLAPDAAAARLRVETNDRLNAQLIIDDGCRERADLIVRTDGRSVRS